MKKNVCKVLEDTFSLLVRRIMISILEPAIIPQIRCYCPHFPDEDTEVHRE